MPRLATSQRAVQVELPLVQQLIKKLNLACSAFRFSDEDLKRYSRGKNQGKPSERATFGPIERAVLFTLMSWGREATKWHAYRSQSGLALESGVSKSCLKRTLERLERAGFVRRSYRQDTQNPRAREYWVLAAWPVFAVPQAVGAIGAGKGAISTRKGAISANSEGIHRSNKLKTGARARVSAEGPISAWSEADRAAWIERKRTERAAIASAAAKAREDDLQARKAHARAGVEASQRAGAG